MTQKQGEVDVERLRELAEAATPGQWLVGAATKCVGVTLFRLGGEQRSGGHVDGWRRIARNLREPDAAYIAAASPDVVIALLDRIAQLEALAVEACDLLDDADSFGRYSNDVKRIRAALTEESKS